MTLRSQYRRILSGIVPAGAVGASLLLGSAVSGSTKEEPAGLQPRSFEPTAVAERLAAIRGAVSDVAKARRADPEMRLAWGNWWRNWGWGGRPRWGWGGGWPNWNNWHNWNNWPNYWRNW
jgi:hypothetical protein